MDTRSMHQCSIGPEAAGKSTNKYCNYSTSTYIHGPRSLRQAVLAYVPNNPLRCAGMNARLVGRASYPLAATPLGARAAMHRSFQEPLTGTFVFGDVESSRHIGRRALKSLQGTDKPRIDGKECKTSRCCCMCVFGKVS